MLQHIIVEARKRSLRSPQSETRLMPACGPHASVRELRLSLRFAVRGLQLQPEDPASVFLTERLSDITVGGTYRFNSVSLASLSSCTRDR